MKLLKAEHTVANHLKNIYCAVTQLNYQMQMCGDCEVSTIFKTHLSYLIHSMKIRLVHKQALLLIASVLVTVIAMGSLSAWNLRNGFSDFLAARDIERLEQFAELVSVSAERSGSIEKMQAQGTGLHELLHEFARTHGVAPIRAIEDAISGHQIKKALGLKPPQRPIDSIDAFKDRIAVYNKEGRLILGSPSFSASVPTIDRPITVNQQVVAFVRMTTLKPVPNEVEYRFLTLQYKSTLTVAILLLLSALIIALWISKQWVKPLLEVQNASEQIAQGKFQTRLSTERSDEIGDAMRNINSMASSLEKLEASRRQWLADMSHELRTPLTVLKGEIEALQDGVIKLSPEALISLREEVVKINALVEDLHLLAMSDLKALPCYFEEIDAKKLIANIVQRFQRQANQKGLKLQCQLSVNPEVVVHWDKQRIEQLIGNLIDNSLRHTDAPGNVILKVKTTSHQTVLISIEDTAPSVSTKDLQRMFEPLFRADKSRVRSTGGSGLGLAICKQITKSHHGNLVANISELGGIKMRLELPINFGTVS
jgi:two-component system sensor histidine kinase BaeS